MSKAWKQMLRHISAHSPWYLQAFRPQQQTHTNNHHHKLVLGRPICHQWHKSCTHMPT